MSNSQHIAIHIHHNCTTFRHTCFKLSTYSRAGSECATLPPQLPHNHSLDTVTHKNGHIIPRHVHERLSRMFMKANRPGKPSICRYGLRSQPILYPIIDAIAVTCENQSNTGMRFPKIRVSHTVAAHRCCTTSPHTLPMSQLFPSMT